MDSAAAYRKIRAMCVLVLLHRCVSGFPIVVGANRDEARTRPSSPPGLLEAGARRALAPRDRQAQGTWLGFNDRGVFAALTNRPGENDVTRPSRGALVPLALSEETASAALARLARRVENSPDNPFRMVVSDGRDAFAIANDGTAPRELEPGLHWLSNEHGLDAFALPSIKDLTRVQTRPEAEGALWALLRDHTIHERDHCFCKHGEERGTVSSSIVSIPDSGPLDAGFWFANGMPCQNEYQRYSNLTERLRFPEAP